MQSYDDAYVQNNSPPKEVTRLKPGDFFGERALIKNEARAATVQVVGGPMQCLCLDREAFCLLLGPLGELLNRRIDEQYDGKIPQKITEKKASFEENNPKNDRFLDIKKEDLVVIGVLGMWFFVS